VVVVAAFALLLIGFSQTAGDAQAFATKHRYRIDLDQESVAQGMANLGAGVFQGMPVSTSLSASSLNESAGARTPVASLITGGIVLATLVVLAPLFAELPKAVLAAIIIDAVVFGMIDVDEFIRLRRVKRFDFWIAVVALLSVLSVGVLFGVIVGIGLSLLWLIHVATRPSMPILGRKPGTQVYRDLDEHPGDEIDPGVVVVRIEGGVFFATAAALDERVRAILASETGLHTLVLDLAAVTFVDSQGAAKIGELLGLTEAEGVDLRLARLQPEVADVLAADGVIGIIGDERIHGRVQGAVAAAQAAHTDP
jgi:SulP family sulfate permease